jgi:hypothetical protein
MERLMIRNGIPGRVYLAAGSSRTSPGRARWRICLGDHEPSHTRVSGLNAAQANQK